MPKISAWFAFAVLLCSRDVLACAPAPRMNERIDVVEETAVIIWEPATKTQHFIRRATFRGEADTFGFLVPTPAAPKLFAVDDDVFRRMREITAPETIVKYENRIDWMPLLFMPFVARYKGEGAIPTTAAAPVEVLSTQKVGGYEAAILEASDADALNKWLGDNGYESSPELAEWLKAYVEQRWIISAFKIDKSENLGRTQPVRMSFTTERPFFPYREPASQREGATEPRVLSIFFIGPERVTGRIGGNTPWPGQLQWSDRVRDLEVAGIKVSPELRLSAWEDHSSPRPGTDDLFFERDPDQQRVLPPPVEQFGTRTTHVPLDLVLVPAIVIGWGVRRAMKRRVK